MKSKLVRCFFNSFIMLAISLGFSTYAIADNDSASMQQPPEYGYPSQYSESNDLGAVQPIAYNHSGLYLGGDVFWFNHTQPNGVAYNSQFEGGIGGGAFVGYQFNPYIAVEAGYEYFQIDSENGYYFNNTFVNAPDHYYLQGADVLAKGIIPIFSHLTLNGYGGVSIINENTYNVIFPGIPPIVDSNVTNVMPTVGAGASLYLMRHVSLDASVLYAIKVGDINSILSVPISLTIHF